MRLPGYQPSPKTPVDVTPSNPWHPFSNHLDFKFADIYFSDLQSSKPKINQALDFWLATTMHAGGNIDNLPWCNADQMYQTIDSIKAGPAPWKTVQFCYSGPWFPATPPKWHFNPMSFASMICTLSCRTSLLHLTFMAISLCPLHAVQ